ncbi:hypothetical protein E2C01_036478 [Portunus trituberculatus]|uniref:Uncharacterized protein n=1 Tax=Portunus trituberculatus TaxID=210409 RepID=A0A5B7FBA2_PORTR|nr:hypothetical protein [Portunus trituberculatus]
MTRQQTFLSHPITRQCPARRHGEHQTHKHGIDSPSLPSPQLTSRRLVSPPPLPQSPSSYSSKSGYEQLPHTPTRTDSC